MDHTKNKLETTITRIKLISFLVRLVIVRWDFITMLDKTLQNSKMFFKGICEEFQSHWVWNLTTNRHLSIFHTWFTAVWATCVKKNNYLSNFSFGRVNSIFHKPSGNTKHNSNSKNELMVKFCSKWVLTPKILSNPTWFAGLFGQPLICPYFIIFSSDFLCNSLFMLANPTNVHSPDSLLDALFDTSGRGRKSEPFKSYKETTIIQLLHKRWQTQSNSQKHKRGSHTTSQNSIKQQRKQKSSQDTIDTAKRP